MLYAKRRILEIRFVKSRVIIKRNFAFHKILTQKKETKDIDKAIRVRVRVSKLLNFEALILPNYLTLS